MPFAGWGGGVSEWVTRLEALPAFLFEPHIFNILHRLNVTPSPRSSSRRIEVGICIWFLGRVALRKREICPRDFAFGLVSSMRPPKKLCQISCPSPAVYYYSMHTHKNLVLSLLCQSFSTSLCLSLRPLSLWLYG